MNIAPLTRVLTCYKVHVALLAILSSAYVLFDVSPEKQAEATKLVIGIFSLAGTIIAAAGYAEGQQGTTTPPPLITTAATPSLPSPAPAITLQPQNPLSLNTPAPGNFADSTANHTIASLSQ